MSGYILPLPQYAIMVYIVNSRMMYLRDMQDKWESADRLDLV